MSSAYINAFLSKNKSVPNLTPFVVVHERPAELIQGGEPGDHYHVTAAQVASLLELIAVQFTEEQYTAILALLEGGGGGSSGYYEPAMVDGEIVTTILGDIVMVHVVV